jgi:hypothetical protein
MRKILFSGIVIVKKPPKLNRSSKKKNETQLSNGNPEELVLDEWCAGSSQ